MLLAPVHDKAYRRLNATINGNTEKKQDITWCKLRTKALCTHHHSEGRSLERWIRSVRQASVKWRKSSRVYLLWKQAEQVLFCPFYTVTMGRRNSSVTSVTKHRAGHTDAFGQHSWMNHLHWQVSTLALCYVKTEAKFKTSLQVQCFSWYASFYGHKAKSLRLRGRIEPLSMLACTPPYP